MAGYRPKSLDELNEMYDKTIIAEKAIIKATKQLHDVTETIVPSALPAEEAEISSEDTNAVEEFSSEVDSLINRFKEETTKTTVKETAKTEIPEIESPVFPVVPDRISFEKEVVASAAPEEEIAKPAPVVQSRPKVHYSLETPDDLRQKANAKSEERTDLFNEYKKIMNDEDDDFFSHRDKKKDKKKKQKKGLFFRHEPKEEEEAIEEFFEEPSSNEEDPLFSLPDSENEAELPVKEVLYTPDVPDEAQSFKVEFEAYEDDEDNQEFASFTEYEPSQESQEKFIEPFTDESDEEEAEPLSYEEEVASHPDFDIISDTVEDTPPVPQEIADKTYDEFMNDSEDIYSFDPSKKNTIPEYAIAQYSDEAEEEEAEEFFSEDLEEEAVYVKPHNKKGLVAGRIILSLILAVLTVLAAGIIGINTLLGVNSGNTALGEKYIFTATQNYTNSNILEGDLIVTEKRFANDGEVFAYINYTQQCFMFGKRNGSIVNDSGDVLFIAENDGERVLVLRDDTRGVVTATYPGIGKIVTICTSYFIPIIAAILILGLVIVLLLSFVFKDKEKAYDKMMKKMIKKGIISAEDETDYNYSDSVEDENIFSTIE